MRWITPARALPVAIAVALAGPIPSASASDDLFSRSYQPYLKSAPAPTAPLARSAPSIVPAPTYVAPPVMAPVSDRSSAVTRPQITWLKGGRGPAVGLPHAELPPTTPAPGQSVAAALSVVASPPDYVPAASKGLAHRLFGSTDPDVPPGLPRGSVPVAMIPPEPLEPLQPAPALARTERRGADRLAAPRGYATDLETSRSSYAAPSSRLPERSLFAPVRPQLADERADRLGLAERRRADYAVPFQIARPAESNLGEPIRRVGPAAADLAVERDRSR